MYWRLVWQLPMYGGAVATTFALLKANAQAVQAGEAEAPQAVREPEPTHRVIPAPVRKDRDDAPPARTNMEREAQARGEHVEEVPLSKMELLMGQGWFSHGRG